MASDEELLRQASKPEAEALSLHPFYKGKIQTLPKCAIRNLADFSIWYSPGVAAPCKAIVREPELVYEYTNKGNTVAVVSDGTRVLGLGDIGPSAALPVMEGKALLFKFLGGVDAVPLCLQCADTEQFIQVVKSLEPSFGGINLEDIAQPKCFRILERLRSEMQIPVWHDDQQGTAVVTLAALLNAFEVVGKDIANARIVLLGIGAANTATYRLLKAYGLDPGQIVACDSEGTLHPDRDDIARTQIDFPDKWQICRESNSNRVRGSVAHSLKGADACLAFSKPDPTILRPDWIRTMAREPIVFACANPIPEIWPWDAHAAGATIVATARGDFPNQVNNSLCFPAMFRAVLDVRASSITDEMALAAARSIADFARRRGIDAASIVPRMDEWDLYPEVATAVALAAQSCGVTRLDLGQKEVYRRADEAIRNARAATKVLMREGVIATPPMA